MLRLFIFLVLVIGSVAAFAQSTDKVDATKLNGYVVLTPPPDKAAAPKLNGYVVLTPPPDKVAAVKMVTYVVLVPQYPHVTIMGE